MNEIVRKHFSFIDYRILAFHKEETESEDSRDVVVELGFPSHGLSNDAIITYLDVIVLQRNVSSNPYEIHSHLGNFGF